MPIDPQIDALLQLFKAVGFPSFATLTPEQARQFDAPSGRVESVAYVRNETICDRDIPVRIYRPSAEGDLPALIYYHGGGWVKGNIDSSDGLCRMLSNRAGCAVVSVGYRLAPEHKFPAAVEDAYAAAQWAWSHAIQFGIDPVRIAIGGDSAGGNLAAVVAYLARERRGPHIMHQVLLYPATTLAEETNSRRLWAAGPYLTKAELDWYFGHYLTSYNDRFNPLVSPLLIEDVAGLPAALIITAECDPLRDEGKAYAERLQRAGVSVNYAEYTGMVHGFIDFALEVDQGMVAIRQVAQTLRQAFDRPLSPT